MAITRNSSVTTGDGPGGKSVGVTGVIALGLYCIAAFLFCGIALVELWPHPTPAGTTPSTTSGATTDTAAPATVEKPGTKTTPDDTAVICTDQSSRCAECEKAAAAFRQRSATGAESNDPECVHVLWMWLILWQEERLLLIVLLAGALGALLHTSRSFTTYVGARKFVLSWVPWYAVTPFVGAFLAMVFYLTIRGGFFSSNAPVGATSPFGFAAVAALVGMFSRQATEKLLKTFEAIFTVAPQETEGIGTGAPTPVLDSVTGVLTAGQAAQVTLKGSGFTEASKVHLGPDEVPTEWTSDTELKATVPAALLPAAGVPLSFTVVTPPPGGGESEVRTL